MTIRFSARQGYIIGIVSGYFLFAGAWVLLSNRLLSMFSSVEAMLTFQTIKGLIFVFITTLLLLIALIAIPADTPTGLSPVRRVLWPRLIAAQVIPALAVLIQIELWEWIQPYSYFLLYPAIFLSSWVGGLTGGVIATLGTTLAVWYIFIPIHYSFSIERPTSFISIGFFFAMGVMFSLTHHRLRSAERNASDNKFYALVEQSLAGLYIIQDGRIRYASPEFARLLGQPEPERLIGQPVRELIVPEDWSRIAARIEQPDANARDELRQSLRARHAEGHLIDLDLYGRTFSQDGCPAMIGLAVDVTPHRAAERARDVAQRRLALALAAGGMGVWEWHSPSDTLSCSPECAGLLGVEEGNPTPQANLSRVHPEDLERLIQETRQALARQHTLVTEFRIVRPNQEIEWLASLAAPRYDDKGQPVGLIGTLRDITEHRRILDELRQRNEELEQLNAAAVGREIDMIALKRQINTLSAETGRPPPYDLSFAEDAEADRMAAP